MKEWLMSTQRVGGAASRNRRAHRRSTAHRGVRTRVRLGGSVLAAGLLLALGAGGLHAQQGVDVEVRGGTAIPAGELSDAADVGGAIGVGVSYWVTSRIGLRLDGDVDILGGADIPGGGSMPDMTLWHYTAGAEVSALDRNSTPWTVLLNGGLGATTLDTDRFGNASGGTQDITQTYFALNWGVKVGYDVNRSVNVSVGTQAFVTFTDKGDLRPLAALSPSFVETDNVWTFPITAAVRFSI